MTLRRVAVALAIALFANTSQASTGDAVNAAINKLCTLGNVHQAESEFRAIQGNAQAYHSLAALELILHADVDNAVSLHKKGKAADPTVIPPLAKLHLDKLACSGLEELFYVSAVIIKELVDTNKALPNVRRAFKTLITMTSDIGLDQMAETLLSTALTLAPADTSLLFRAAVLTPGVYESMDHIESTRALLEHRIDRISDAYSDLTLSGLDEFVMSPTFYFVYQGYNDRDIMSKLQYGYTKAYPRLGSVEIALNVQQGKYAYQQSRAIGTGTSGVTSPASTALPIDTILPSAAAVARPRKIRVGFVSSYFRRHSICKLFCGIMTNLDQNLYEVYAFASMRQNEEDKVTLALRHSHVHFVSVGMTFIQNRNEVTDRFIDILVYLDVGMDPSIAAWAAARLAPVQMVIWGHPSTTGYASIDYYLSSEKFHRHQYQQYQQAPLRGASSNQHSTSASYASDAFAEQLVLFDTLGFYFERPVLESDIISKIGADIAASLAPQRQISDTDTAVASNESELSVQDLPLVHHPTRYYDALRNQLSTYKTSAAAQIIELITAKTAHNASIALCPQHMPKFHPHFDAVITGILMHSPNTRIVLIDSKKKRQWRITLTERWGRTLTAILTKNTPVHETPDGAHTGSANAESAAGASPVSIQDTVEALLSRIVWLDGMSPQEYLHLMAVGDVMLDPFPFGGGVTTLESVAVCTPVITLPSAQSVPQLAAGMLYHMGMSAELQNLLVVPSVEEYLYNALSMLRAAESNGVVDVRSVTHTNAMSMVDIREELCKHAHMLYSKKDTLQDWNIFLSAAV